MWATNTIITFEGLHQSSNYKFYFLQIKCWLIEFTMQLTSIRGLNIYSKKVLVFKCVRSFWTTGQTLWSQQALVTGVTELAKFSERFWLCSGVQWSCAFPVCFLFASYRAPEVLIWLENITYCALFKWSLVLGASSFLHTALGFHYYISYQPIICKWLMLTVERIIYNASITLMARR